MLANRLICVGKQLTWSIFWEKSRCPGGITYSRHSLFETKQIQKANRPLAIWSREGGSLLDETETRQCQKLYPCHIYSGKKELFIARLQIGEHLIRLSIGGKVQMPSKGTIWSQKSERKNHFPRERIGFQSFTRILDILVRWLRVITRNIAYRGLSNSKHAALRANSTCPLTKAGRGNNRPDGQVFDRFLYRTLALFNFDCPMDTELCENDRKHYL